MFNTITESIDGKKFNLAYNARQVTMERSTPARQRSARIRGVARTHKAGFAIVSREGDNDVVFLHRSSGISFQSQLENWMREHPPAAAAFTLVITLDTAVYFATVADGYIDNEEVLVEEAAREQLTALTNAATPLVGFSGGESTLELPIDDLAGTAPVTIKGNTPHQYRRLAMLMTRQGMVHPAQIVLAALLTLLILAATIGYQSWQSRIDQIALDLLSEQRRLQQQAVGKIAGADHSAARRIAEMARVFTLAEQLYSSGLTALEYSQAASITGVSRDFPRFPAWLSSHLPWKITLGPGGEWALSTPSQILPDVRPPGPFGQIRMLEYLHSVAAHSSAQLEISGYDKRAGIARIDFTLTLPGPNPSDLQALAERLRNQPFELVAARCGFQDWTPDQCGLQLRAATAEENS